MLEKDTIEKYYKEVPEDELNKFQDFLKSHSLKHFEYKGQSIPYYSCGHGEKTILFPPGGAGGIFPPEYGFRSISSLEKEFRVIAPGSAEVSSLDELSAFINSILDAEGAGKVIIVAGSGQGVPAQAYFKRNFSRVESMVLYQTFAPKKERNKKWALLLIKLLPSGLFRAMVNKKLKSLVTENIPLEAHGRILISKAFLKEVMSEKFNKNTLLSFIKLAFEFNEHDGYTKDEFKDWKGKILIMTSEDDNGYKDTPYLMENLPHTSLHKFPPGYKHQAPTVFFDEFIKQMKDFIKNT